MSPKQKVRLSNRQKHAGIRTKLVTGNRIRCFRCFSVFLFLFFENHWGRQSRSGVKCNKAMMGTIMSNHDGNYKSGGQEKVQRDNIYYGVIRISETMGFGGKYIEECAGSRI